MKRIVTTKGLVLFLFIAIVLSWCFSACSKNNENPEPRIKTVVHIVGTIEKGNKVLANYWKDGTNPITIQALDDNDAEAYGLAVVGNDVYVAEVDLSGTKPAAVYWKNGKKQHISDNASAYGIAVEDDDIYVVGTEIAVESKSKLWKDGVATVLWEGGIGLSAKSIVLTKEVY